MNILKMNKGGRSNEAEGLVNDPKREGLRWENKQGGTGFLFYQRHKREVLEQIKKISLHLSQKAGRDRRVNDLVTAKTGSLA